MEKYRLVQEHKADSAESDFVFPAATTTTASADSLLVTTTTTQQQSSSSSSSMMQQEQQARGQQLLLGTIGVLPSASTTPSSAIAPAGGTTAATTTTTAAAAVATTTAPGGTSSSSIISSNIPEVRITQQGKPRNYISYAMGLFADGSNAIVLKAMGRAMNKAVTIAEILKRKMPLHQQNMLSSVEMIDVYEPVEEGLDMVTSRRYVSCMMIILSLTLEAGVDPDHYGYQPPLPDENIQPGDVSSGGGISTPTATATPTLTSSHSPSAWIATA